jgi:membrane-bound lytic murein transglycosylase D
MRRRLVGGLLLVVMAAGCQRVGVVEPPVQAPVPQVSGPAIPELVGARPGPVRATPLPPVEVEPGVDAILHSLVASDPRLQERVDFWVDFWSTRGAGHFARYLERMALYEGLVERELLDRGLPLSLKYLPIVESGYHDVAVSRVGATGLWQLMAPTAGGLGLTVSAVVDERRDAVASTRAALDYLQEMHGMFDSWFLALAAYNAGPGRIRGIVNRQAPDREVLDDRLYLELRSHLPAETREFVPRFFAAARIARDPEAHGFGRPVGVAPLAFDEVVVPDATSLDVVAWAAGVEEAEVRRLNPHYLRGFTPQGQARSVRVPAGTGARFEVAYASLPPEERISYQEHVVARGETLGGIAGRFGVRVADLQAANGNVDPRRLQIGQRLVIPVAGGRRPSTPAPTVTVAEASPAPAPAAAPAPADAPAPDAPARAPEPSPTAAAGAPEPPPTAAAEPPVRTEVEPAVEPVVDEASPASGGASVNGAGAAPPRMHTVASGDNLWSLARRYGVTVAQLERWNGLSSGRTLRPGERLAVSEGARTHTVVRGDTWGTLARRYGVSTSALAQANGRSTSQVIRVGEELRIP